MEGENERILGIARSEYLKYKKMRDERRANIEKKEAIKKEPYVHPRMTEEEWLVSRIAESERAGISNGHYQQRLNELKSKNEEGANVQGKP